MLTSNPASLSTRSTIRPHRDVTDSRVQARITELLAILRLALPHVFVIGRDSDLAAIVQRIHPYLLKPIAGWAPNLTSEVPAAPFRTLLVQDVRDLNARQQARLVTIADSPNIQIISLTSTPIFPLIETGAFLDDLYYRLNRVTLNLNAHD